MPSEQSDVADELIQSAGGLTGVSHYCPDLSRYAFVLLQIQDFSIFGLAYGQSGLTYRLPERRIADALGEGGSMALELRRNWCSSSRGQMTAHLAEAYTQAANDNDVFVIPAGLAFACSISQRPDLNLHAADKRHPSLLGTYLGACTVYASLFKNSPVGVKYTAGIDEATAKFLQTVAWETVQAYFTP